MARMRFPVVLTPSAGIPSKIVASFTCTGVPLNATCNVTPFQRGARRDDHDLGYGSDWRSERFDLDGTRRALVCSAIAIGPPACESPGADTKAIATRRLPDGSLLPDRGGWLRVRPVDSWSGRFGFNTDAGTPARERIRLPCRLQCEASHEQ